MTKTSAVVALSNIGSAYRSTTAASKTSIVIHNTLIF
jgi:hypothetical protein